MIEGIVERNNEKVQKKALFEAVDAECAYIIQSVA